METPHDKQAEIAVIAALLNDDNAAEIALSDLDVNDFYVPIHRRIFEAAQHAFDRHNTANDLVVHDSMQILGYGDHRREMTQIAMQMLNAANIDVHCKILKGKTAVRQLHFLAERISAGIERNEESKTIIDAACGKMDEIHARLLGVSEEPADMHEMAEIIAEGAINGTPRSYLGLQTGLANCAFDQLTGGIQRQHYWVLAARTSVGKSTFVNALALCTRAMNPDAGDPLIVSTEMSLKGLATKGLAMVSGVHTDGLMKRDLTGQQKQSVAQAIEDKRLEGVKIAYVSGASVGQVKALAKRHKRKFGLPLLIVDLAGQLRARGGTEREQLAAVSASLAALKVELDCCVVACVQLSRAVFTKDDCRPELNHLKGSGSWEEDADKVIFLHRPGYYHSSVKDSRTEIIQAKDRDHGKVESIFVEYDKYRGSYTVSCGD